MVSPTHSSVCTVEYSKKRYFTFGIIFLLAFILPFIVVDDNHIFLLSFDKKQLHLLFVAFDMQELYLMPFLLIILFISIFLMTTLGGRVWCGWACPQTIFRVFYRDLIQTKLLGIRQNISNKQTPTKSGKFSQKFLASTIWIIISFLIASIFMWYFVPPEDFFIYIQSPSKHPILVGFVITIALFLIYDVIFLKEDFCIHVCPYARIQSVMYDDDTIQTIYNPIRGGIIFDEYGNKLWSKPPGDKNECTGCEACVRICPTHIDIRKGMQLECINCLECVDACTKVMNKLGKETLVSWTSPNAVFSDEHKVHFIRAKTIAYGVALVIAFTFLMFMSSKKEFMLLNINRTTQLYKIKEDSVENAYTFLFQNTDKVDHSYYFELNHPNIKIESPKKPFLIQAGQKARKIVVLSANEALTSKKSEDITIPITIKAFAMDDKERIFVNRDTIFIYPSKSTINKAFD
ncbi:MAG: cytochrome c oxidase accessory protein CcoG [Campylobacteraceae bacterium]|nr:cytochrome c oxidase accessory protein CcoG [Campylobacteraceae bacterium]